MRLQLLLLFVVRKDVPIFSGWVIDTVLYGTLSPVWLNALADGYLLLLFLILYLLLPPLEVCTLYSYLIFVICNCIPWYHRLSISLVLYLFKNYPTPCHWCFVVLMLRVICFCLKFDSLFSFFCCCCLSSCGKFPLFEIVQCLETVLIDLSISLLSHVPVLLFPVTSYLLFIIPPNCCVFFFAAVNLRFDTLCQLFLTLFYQIGKNIVLVFLVWSAAGNSLQ